MENKPLPLKVKLGFGVGDLGGNLYFTLIGFYLLFYLTDIVKLKPAYVAAALAIGKIWDAVTDPAVGHISDRTRTRWGRRRPYLFYGSFLLFLSMILMFTPAAFEAQTALFLWATLAFCVLGTAYTLVNIPYGCLLPELTTDFNERTTLSGFRMSFALVGTLVGAGATLPLVGLFAATRTGWAVTGAIMGAIMAGSALVTFAVVREPEHPEPPRESAVVSKFLQALRSRVFLLALVPWVLHITGVTVIQGALLYYFQYVYGSQRAFQPAMMLLLVTSLLFIPVWVHLAGRIGKKRCYNVGMAIVGAAVLLFFAVGHRGLPLAYVLMVIAGIGLSTNYVMPNAILPDVVEHDYADGGTRREGVFYGLWTFGSKVGQALALGVGGGILALFGYVAGAEQTAQALLGIRLLCGPIPLLFFVGGIIVLSFYPIDRDAYEELRRRIDLREKDKGRMG